MLASSCKEMATSSSSSQEFASKRPVPLQLRQVSSRKSKKIYSISASSKEATSGADIEAER